VSGRRQLFSDGGGGRGSNIRRRVLAAAPVVGPFLSVDGACEAAALQRPGGSYSPTLLGFISTIKAKASLILPLPPPQPQGQLYTGILKTLHRITVLLSSPLFLSLTRTCGKKGFDHKTRQADF